MELRRILVPYDFSDAAGHAACYACDLAALFRAEVTLMHVLTPLRYDYAMTEPSADRLKEAREHRMANAREALGAALPGLGGAIRIRRVVTEGDAAEEIVTAANDGGHDTIVMSTRGAGAFSRWFIIGSVTSKVLHASERPVITSVHFENHRAPLEIRRVMCAIDLGPQSMRVLCWGLRSARTFRSALDVVHAAPPLESIPDGEEGRALRAAAGDKLRARIEELKRDLGVEAETVIEFDHPARAISELARTRGADLLVLGRGVSQDLVGRLRANAYDIIRQCPCPVVSI